MDTKATGKFISERRKELGKTQADLAGDLNVSDKAVSRWETGRGFPDIGSLEALAAALDVTVAELLRGERMPEQVPAEDINALAEDGLSFARETMNKRRFRNYLAGFLLGAALIVLAVVHMVSPVYIKNAGEAVSVDKLSDGSLVAVINGSDVQYDVGSFTDPDTGRSMTFISCYRTRMNSLREKLRRGTDGRTAVVIGRSDEIMDVYYYPTDGEDELIYTSGGEQSRGGVMTLPRLIYNYWIIIGVALSAAGGILWFAARKKYYAKYILRATLLPVSFVISTVVCLAGHFTEVYNAGFYLTGIMIVTILLYTGLCLTVGRRAEK